MSTQKAIIILSLMLLLVLSFFTIQEKYYKAETQKIAYQKAVENYKPKVVYKVRVDTVYIEQEKTGDAKESLGIFWAIFMSVFMPIAIVF